MAQGLLKSLAQKLEARRDFRSTTVFIISFPKSGRTWLRLLIGKALCDRYHQPEELMLETPQLTRSAGLPQAVFTHEDSSNTEGVAWDRLESDKSRYRRKKVLFLVRDPRDVVVSCYFQATRRKGLFKGSISDFLRHDNYGIRKIITFYNIWHRNRHLPAAFELLRYEDLKADTPAGLRAALGFLGARELPERAILDAVEYARFENMKRMEEEGRFQSKIMRPGKSGDEESFKVRRGKIGGFVDYLDEEDCRYADAVIAELGCPFLPSLESKFQTSE